MLRGCIWLYFELIQVGTSQKWVCNINIIWLEGTEPLLTRVGIWEVRNGGSSLYISGAHVVFPWLSSASANQVFLHPQREGPPLEDAGVPWEPHR